MNDRFTIEEADDLAANSYNAEMAALGKQLADTMRENERLRDALEFYAKESNYHEEILNHIFRTTQIREDGGSFARAVLSNKDTSHES